MFYHDSCGGVTNGQFKVTAFMKGGSSYSTIQPLVTWRLLGSALGAKVSGFDWRPLLQQDQHNLSRGILKWTDQTKPILAESVFNKFKGLRRQITRREMRRVFDYPEERIQKMTEDQLRLLTTDEEIPGKIFYSTLFLITTLESSLNVTNQPKDQDLNQLST